MDTRHRRDDWPEDGPTEEARFVRAVNEGLADLEVGRELSPEEVEARLGLR